MRQLGLAILLLLVAAPGYSGPITYTYTGATLTTIQGNHYQPANTSYRCLTSGNDLGYGVDYEAHVTVQFTFDGDLLPGTYDEIIDFRMSDGALFSWSTNPGAERVFRIYAVDNGLPTEWAIGLRIYNAQHLNFASDPYPTCPRCLEVLGTPYSNYDTMYYFTKHQQEPDSTVHVGRDYVSIDMSAERSSAELLRVTSDGSSAAPGTWTRTNQAVPDPGSSLLLLGMSLTGLVAARRWRR